MTDALRRAIYASACAGAIAFSAAMMIGPPERLPWYEPLQRTWIVSSSAPSTVAMDFYARIGIAFAIALAVSACVFFLAKRRDLSVTITRALGFWAWALLLLAMFLYGYSLNTRHIEPPHTKPTRGL